MAQNYVQPGEAVTVIAPAGGVIAGNAYLLGTGKVAVSLQTKAAGASCEMATGGVYSLTKLTPLVINQGDLLYWDDTAKSFSKTNTGVLAGWAFQGALSAATTVQVKLND